MQSKNLAKQSTLKNPMRISVLYEYYQIIKFNEKIMKILYVKILYLTIFEIIKHRIYIYIFFFYSFKS